MYKPMYMGQIISGAGHAALILWLLLGDWLFSPPEPEDLPVVTGSIMSSADFEALQAAARASEAVAPEPVEEPPEPEVVEPPPEPEVTETPPEPEVVEPPPEPDVVELPPEPEEVPEGQTGFAEPSPLPPSDDPQPLPTPLTDARPRPRPSDVVAPVPVEETPDVAEADVPTPAVTEQETETPVEEPPEEAAAPAAASTEIVPEQPEEVVEPTLAPTSSPRPRARPTQVAAVEPEEVAAEAPPVEEPAPVEDPPAEEPAPEEPAPDVSATDQAAIDAALEAALQGEETDGGGTTRSLGESLNAAEMNGLANAINRCWDLGAASTAALNVSVTLLVTLDQSSRPIDVELLDSTGDTPAAIDTARRAAITAVRDCGREGLGLPPEKYETWKQIEVVFDPRGAQLR
jgi:outer membrane biosynthesis protein TonB